MKVKVKEFNKIATTLSKTLTNKGIVNKIKIKKTTNTEIYYR
jgi:hypothetical protein